MKWQNIMKGKFYDKVYDLTVRQINNLSFRQVHEYVWDLVSYEVYSQVYTEIFCEINNRIWSISHQLMKPLY